MAGASRRPAASAPAPAAPDGIPSRPVKGRGAVGNAAGRFEPHTREAVDDGWPAQDHEDPDQNGGPAPLRTTVAPDRARTIIARNASPDIGFDRSINPYRGCEHGCVYCFARPTHAYLGLSAGLDFETRLFAKHDAAALLRRELAKPGYACAPIALGANTDPYQPIERRLKITRAVIAVLDETRHPVMIVTKSHGVLRDRNLLTRMAEANLASVSLSVTTLDAGLARRMEPRAPAPAARLQAIEALAKAGIPVSVLAAPMIPGINDSELERILEAAASAGATRAGYVLLRVPLEIDGLVSDWLEAHRPGQAKKVFALLRQAHGGKAYRSEFGHRQRGAGPYAAMLADRFALACRKLGLDRARPALDTTQFRPPAPDQRQLALF